MITFVLDMELIFYKYQGAGNDFVMIDNLSGKIDSLDSDTIARICDRRFGVGGDGLIILESSAKHDFYINYYNSDGSQSFCGNGARCSVLFARHMGYIRSKTTFEAIDGTHTGEVISENQIMINMLPVKKIVDSDGDYVLDTGSPHYVRFSDSDDDIVSFGREIRYSDRFAKEGINVNLVKRKGNLELEVLTYERGVEAETLSCGTGVTACALVELQRLGVDEGEVHVYTKGGEINVKARREGDGFADIYLSGPAEFVFEGKITV